ncbi:asparagine-rich protein isoform X1 [Vespa crabro]|uniref:asparagine-rich protein isoform X1 n=1 Tax=Vespa crabro TaxID=7445 RepID=UPI001F01DC25|nr:asparagine-rich protein isoform X1 [Vespa crabro]
MSDKLLIKEKELYRLNKALEIKTRHVLEEIKSITDRRIHDNSSRQNNDTHNTTDRNKRNSEYSMNTNNKLLQNITIERNPVSLDTLTEGTSNLSKQNFENFRNQNGANKVNEIVLYEGNSPENKALINFLKSKIDMLYNELKVIQVEYKNKVNDCERLEGENKKLDCCKLKLHNQVASLKETVTKLENNNSNLHEQNLASNTENSNLKKDIEGLRKEIKTLNNQLNNYDLRLNRSLEENEKLKNTIKFNHFEEKELRDQIRKLQEDKRQGIKHLEKQRLELLQAFKKQLLLIDNLKKQNAFMTAVEHMQLVEEDFSKLLLWKPNNL